MTKVRGRSSPLRRVLARRTLAPPWSAAASCGARRPRAG